MLCSFGAKKPSLRFRGWVWSVSPEMQGYSPLHRRALECCCWSPLRGALFPNEWVVKWVPGGSWGDRWGCLVFPMSTASVCCTSKRNQHLSKSIHPYDFCNTLAPQSKRGRKQDGGVTHTLGKEKQCSVCSLLKLFSGGRFCLLLKGDHWLRSNFGWSERCNFSKPCLEWTFIRRIQVKIWSFLGRILYNWVSYCQGIYVIKDFFPLNSMTTCL